MDVIEIEVDRYEELLRIETAYNLYRDKLKQDAFVPELERTLFSVAKNTNPEDDDF